MRKPVSVFVAVMMGIALLFGNAALGSAADKPIVLKAASFLPYHPGGRFDNAVDYCKRVTERSKGALVVKFLGGGETIPGPRQVQAVRSGVLDISWTAASFYARLLPETLCFSASELSAAEERSVGFYDYINGLHKKLGLVYLGRNRGDGFYWASNKLIKDPHQDFKGLKFAVIGTFWNSFSKKLNIIPVNVPIPERYTALERGVVDGVGVAGVGAAALGTGEVTKYYIDHAFLTGGSGSTIMNLKSWNSLPKHLQDLLMAEFINYEKELPNYWAGKIEKERSILKKQGMAFIKFSPADADWYVKTANDAKWEEVKAAVPDAYPKLKDMLTKK